MELLSLLAEYKSTAIKLAFLFFEKKGTKDKAVQEKYRKTMEKLNRIHNAVIQWIEDDPSWDDEGMVI